MLGWIKSLLSGVAAGDSSAESSQPDDLWNALEKMDSRNSLTRLRNLNLSSEQYPIVKGLLEGTLSPEDRPGNTEWCRDQGVATTGLDALTHALQIVLESDGTTYVFSEGQNFPTAMMPKFVSRKELSIVMNMTAGSPYVIASLDDFLEDIGVTEVSFETLEPSVLRRRITNEPSFTRDSRDRGAADSVTIEKPTDDNQQLIEPLETSDIVTAVNEQLGIELTPDAIEIQDDKIDETGLYTCIAQVDSITKKKIKVWVVPNA